MVKIKDAYYFSHDANARHDPKIIKMISVYGMKGYGCYWIIIELLREQDKYKLSLNDFDVVVAETQCKYDYIKKFIEDCIQEFKLFKKIKSYFFSNSLIKRMKLMKEKRENARKAANTRWNKEKLKYADVMQTHSERNAIKENKSKGKNKISDPPLLNLEKM